MKVLSTILGVTFLVLTWMVKIFFVWPFTLGHIAEEVVGADEDDLLPAILFLQVVWIILLMSAVIWVGETFGKYPH